MEDERGARPADRNAARRAGANGLAVDDELARRVHTPRRAQMLVHRLHVRVKCVLRWLAARGAVAAVIVGDHINIETEGEVCVEGEELAAVHRVAMRPQQRQPPPLTGW
jgi:hypothetical protein